MSINWKNKSKKRVILLFGPTAVGKTELLNHLQNSYYEIINADSAQVYKGLNIGTAKPDEKMLSRLPHHLINILKPSEQFNVGLFVRLAESKVNEIIIKKRIPIISGGTAFYFKHFAFGLPASPETDKKIREKLLKEREERGLSTLYKELENIDPVYTKKISQNDPVRILRALEVYRKTGKPLSTFNPHTDSRDDYLFLWIGLNRPKDELYRRIERRVDEMFASGLIDEVKDLLQNGYTEKSPGMKAIGYKEFMHMQRGCLSYKDVRDLIARHSKAYAKRQLTFFKALSEDIHWFYPGDFKKILKKIKDFTVNHRN